MSTSINVRRTALRLALALLTAVLPALVPLFGQPSKAAQAKSDASGLHRPVGDTNQQASTSTYTLICFVHTHMVGDPPQNVGSHIAIYTLRWEVSDGSALEFQMSSGQNLPCPGSTTLTVSGAAAGAEGFDTFICAPSEQQGCTLNVPVTGGGSVSGIPGQPTLTVPAGQTAVMKITTEVSFFGVP